MGKRGKHRILVIGQDAGFRNLAEAELSEEFVLSLAKTEDEGFSLMERERPDLILLEHEPCTSRENDFCGRLKKAELSSYIPVIIITKPGEDGRLFLNLDICVDDYLVKPVYVPELQAKIRSCLRSRKLYRSFKKSDLVEMIEIYETVTTFHTIHEILFTITRKLAKITSAARCSVVRLDPKSSSATVIATSEDGELEGLELDIERYPEISMAMELKQEVYVGDMKNDPLTKDVRGLLAGLPFNAVAVVPIALRDSMLGTLLLRVAGRDGLSEKDLSLCTAAAKAAYRVLENARLVESLRIANIELEKLATTDGLTNLYNHRYFYQRLEEEFNIARRYRVPLSCIMLDIDFFKKINDTYGHRIGDVLLKELSATLLGTIRKTDVASRYGGEEFAILLPHTEEKGAMLQAERIRLAIARGKYSALPPGDGITVSLGVATYGKQSGFEPEELVRMADTALYRAKEKGRNCSLRWGD